MCPLMYIFKSPGHAILTDFFLCILYPIREIDKVQNTIQWYVCMIWSQ